MLTVKSKPDLSYVYLHDQAQQKYQLSQEQLITEALNNKEGVLTRTDALAVDTGQFTGRSPKDRYIVCDRITRDTVCWGETNMPFDEYAFEKLLVKVTDHLREKKHFYVNDAHACAYRPYRLHVRTISETAYQNLFASNLFIKPITKEIINDGWTILACPSFLASPELDGTRNGNFTMISFKRKIILVCGSGYAGEIKKSIFSVLNFLMPQYGVLPMHCAANRGTHSGDTALFFGLSGTGKTTLSADPKRLLIGDDEHGWVGNVIFNFEGGCYAKTAGITAESEPQIFAALSKGSILENVSFFPGTNKVDYADITKTENTRAAYPLKHIPGAIIPSVANGPKNIYFLTCDAFGVLPPISLLSEEQAIDFFMAGYTSKVSGTEIGVNEPQATFSACFGQAFLPLHPIHYAHILSKRLEESDCKVWLVNTGWTGGGYATGKRIELSYTRALLNASLAGELDDVPFTIQTPFQLKVPEHCANVPPSLLDPRSNWGDVAAYDIAAEKLFAAYNDALVKHRSSLKAELFGKELHLMQ